MRVCRLGIVGATGAVGKEVLRVLERRGVLSLKDVRLFSSSRSAGTRIWFRGQDYENEELSEGCFAGLDIVILAVEADIARSCARDAVRSGCVVIDNSSAFRMDPDVPLIIPEINGELVMPRKGSIIANPNCTTAITLMALAPLHRSFHVRRIAATSLQAVSGAGQKAIDELEQQMAEAQNDGVLRHKVFPFPILSNAIPFIGVPAERGYSSEEWKLQDESCKILAHESFRASATCVRVPVMRCHTVSVMAEFEQAISADSARECLLAAPGIRVVDDPGKNLYPMPFTATGKDDCEVGRIREDMAFENAISFVVVGDQLLRGAALNAVLIAEKVGECL